MSTKAKVKGVGDYDKACVIMFTLPGLSVQDSAGANYERKFLMTGMRVREGR